MSWARVDDSWWCHRKVLGLDLASRGLWISTLSWSCQHRTADVPTALLGMLGADDVHAGQLVAAGLWIETDGGWRIHDWDAYQDRTLSEKRADAGRKGGRRSGQNRSKVEATSADPAPSDPTETGPDLHEPEANGKQPELASPSKPQANGQAGTRPVPTRPVPTRPEPITSPAGDGDSTALTRTFATMVKANGHALPTKGSKAAETWLVEMDRLLRIGPPGDTGDARPPDVDEIETVMRWALTVSDFWPANIRSVAKFRNQYTTLRAQMRRVNGTQDLAAGYDAVAAELERRGL